MRFSKLVVIVLLLFACGGLIYESFHVVQVSMRKYVVISGTVSVATVGLETNPTPTRIVFTSETGMTYNASVESDRYSVTLPNWAPYTIAVEYSAVLYAGTLLNTCQAGVLDLNQLLVKAEEVVVTNDTVSLAYNIPCSTGG